MKLLRKEMVEFWYSSAFNLEKNQKTYLGCFLKENSGVSWKYQSTK